MFIIHLYNNIVGIIIIMAYEIFYIHVCNHGRLISERDIHNLTSNALDLLLDMFAMKAKHQNKALLSMTPSI